MENKELIIAEFNKDVETVAAIYAKWGASGLAGFLHTMAQSKAAAEDILTNAVMTPDEAKALQDKKNEYSNHVVFTSELVILRKILEELTANHPEQPQGLSTPCPHTAGGDCRHS